MKAAYCLEIIIFEYSKRFHNFLPKYFMENFDKNVKTENDCICYFCSKKGSNAGNVSTNMFHLVPSTKGIITILS